MQVDMSTINSRVKKVLVFILSLCRPSWSFLKNDEQDDDVDDDEARATLARLYNRLEGVLNLIREKKEHVSDEIQKHTAKQMSKKYLLLSSYNVIQDGQGVVFTHSQSTDVIDVELIKMDIMTLIKERKVMYTFYEHLNNVQNNLFRVMLTLEKHRICYSSRVTLDLVPRNFNQKPVEEALTLTTVYNDYVDNVASRLELPMDSRSLQEFPYNDADIKSEMESFLLHSESNHQAKAVVTPMPVAIHHDDDDDDDDDDDVIIDVPML